MRSVLIAARVTILCISLVAVPSACADQHAATDTRTGASSQMIDGEVRRINADAGKITIRHGPIPTLDMPAMTMVYRVKDPAMLEQLQSGDKIRFEASHVNGAFIVTKIRHVN